MLVTGFVFAVCFVAFFLFCIVPAKECPELED